MPCLATATQQVNREDPKNTIETRRSGLGAGIIRSGLGRCACGVLSPVMLVAHGRRVREVPWRSMVDGWRVR